MRGAIFLVILFTSQFSLADIYLRPRNDRGPGATKSGVECLKTVENIYFQNKLSQQIQKLSVFYANDLKNPAADISTNYLRNLHTRLNNDNNQENFQLRIIANETTRSGVQAPKSREAVLTDLYVIIGHSMANIIKNIRIISKTKSFNEEAKFLILNNDIEKRKEGNNFSHDVLQLLFEQYRAVDVVVLYASDAFTYEIYTADPFRDRAHCGKIKADNIGRCENGRLADYNHTRQHLMIEKVPDTMENCTFTLCARVQEPFVDEGCGTGLEILILRFLQNTLRVNINIKCSDLDRGEIIDDGHWSGLLGSVRQDTCDIVAGAFFPDHEVHADFAATEFYLQDFYTFYVKRADYAPRWMGLVKIFKVKTWSAFGVVLIITWIFWWILGNVSKEASHHRKFILTLVNVIAISLSVSANNRPVLNPLRMFFVFFALYSLTITAIYTSKLITVFTNPKLDYQIDSIEEILFNNYSIGGRQENYDWFDNDDKIDQQVFQRYNFSEEFRPSSQSLQKIIREKNIAIIMSKLYVRSKKDQKNVHGLSRSMFSNNLEMIVEKGFPLLKKINEIISTMRDMGLMSKFLEDFHYNTTILAKLRRTSKKFEGKTNFVNYVNYVNGSSPELTTIFEEFSDDEDSESRVVLTVAHLEGGFTLLVVGYVISVAVFAVELFAYSSFYKKCARMCMNIFHIRKKFSKPKLKHHKKQELREKINTKLSDANGRSQKRKIYYLVPNYYRV